MLLFFNIAFLEWIGEFGDAQGLNQLIPTSLLLVRIEQKTCITFHNFAFLGIHLRMFSQSNYTLCDRNLVVLL